MDNETNETATESATSLKYEKTQNRDVVGTIERINRSEKFKPSAEFLIDAFGAAAADTARKAFRACWRSETEAHENPEGLSLDVAIGSPIYRKTADGFHYTMTLTTTFHVPCVCADGETPENAEARMSMWYSEKISPSVNRAVVKELGRIVVDYFDFAGKFSIPDNGDKTEDGKIGRPSTPSRINLTYMSALRCSRADSPSADVLPHKDSDVIREGLVSNVAMAFERIDSANKGK